MSNPFSRSSFKTKSSSPSSRPDSDGSTAVALSVNTRVSAPSQKHVEFASPPAVPISPASYPSSPESTRQSPAYHASFPTAPDYSEAIQVDPFQAAILGDESDIAIEQALQNARTNSEITTSKAVQRSAVKDTLNRFASGPKRSSTDADVSSDQSKSPKQSLDVDAFKRLLLTGERAMSAQQSTSSGRNIQHLVSDSSSSTDTASLSQRSILETVPQMIEATPRSSFEEERGEGMQRPQSLEPQRKPLPPKPRYGRPIKEETAAAPKEPEPSALSGVKFDHPVSTIQAPISLVETSEPPMFSSEGLDPSGVKKRPPTPPLTRRKSQNKAASRPALFRNISSRHSFASSSDEAAGFNAMIPGKVAPPPPPMRRITSHPSQKPSTELPATMEEDDGLDVASIDRVSSSSKRASLNPPPLPPPRRQRGSSRSSVDDQRPSMAQLGTLSSVRNVGEQRRPSDSSTESRNVSGPSNATDILADLAALQREVDVARGQAGT